MAKELTFEQFKEQVEEIMDEQGYLAMLDDEATTDPQIKESWEKGETPKQCAESFIGIEIEEESDEYVDPYNTEEDFNEED